MLDEWRVAEKLNSVLGQGVLRDKLACVRNQMLTRLERQTVFFQSCLELFGLRKHADTLAFAKAMPRLLPPDDEFRRLIVVRATLDNHRCGHPERINLYPIGALVLRSVAKFEELRTVFEMILVPVSERD